MRGLGGTGESYRGSTLPEYIGDPPFDIIRLVIIRETSLESRQSGAVVAVDSLVFIWVAPHIQRSQC